MTPTSRRAAREAAQKQQADRDAAARGPRAGEKKPRRRGARIAWLIVAIVVIVLLGIACWVAFKALAVKNGLEESQQLIGELQNGADPKETVQKISEPARSAAEAASDPVWAALEWVPVAGENLRGVRLAAQSVDVLINDIAMPVLSADAASGSLITQLLDVAKGQAPRIGQLADEIAEVKKSTALVGPVRSGVDQVADVMDGVAPAVDLLPTLLGADGPRNYLLVFQNNAESLALGGSAASQTLVHVDNGAITMGAQGSSLGYQNGVAVDVPVDQSAIDLYSSFLVDHVNTSMSRPDFPTAAKIMRAWWQRDIAADQIDGVISIDPLALSRILVATGPIQLVTGDTLSSENAVSLLLNEVYKRWDSYKYPELVDGFFAAAAGAVFDRVASGQFDLKNMATALTESAAQGSILVWSEDAKVEEAIRGERVSGVLPTTNDDETTLGVYFNNSNGSKIDYYTRTAVTVAETCEADSTTFSVNAAIALPITQEEADALPRYIQSMTFGTTFRDWIYIYGPPGTTVSNVEVNGARVDILSHGIDDLGRPTARFEAWFEPGQRVDVTAAFTGSGSFGPVAVQTNPMINSVEPGITDSCG
ncbi:DUF4012 domain-containing protein [Microbacterium foliorum]|uniref:DUF4012 domain-containing protein n=1 Tax=Microbacterium foliorum TaxID=104336 RepID=UPI001D94F586|nr:DUF4012 domain-containing protein [Microbacterium foliorum]CAH0146642.1 hypothetical protein SRABI44_00607 [Microbacterium foliorum]CAH0148141.1 hypothetical protein SRABI03_00690 [Microbacterium foliorum]